MSCSRKIHYIGYDLVKTFKIFPSSTKFTISGFPVLRYWYITNRTTAILRHHFNQLSHCIVVGVLNIYKRTTKLNLVKSLKQPKTNFNFKNFWVNNNDKGDGETNDMNKIIKLANIHTHWYLSHERQWLDQQYRFRDRCKHLEKKDNSK